MKGYWRRSFYVFLCVGLLFSLVSCGSDDDDSTNTDLLVAFTTNDTFGPGSLQRYNGTTGASLGAFTSGGGLSAPVQAVFGPDGNLYVASFNSNSVERYNGTTGAPLRTFVTPGSGGLNGPTGVAFGRDGNLYVSSNTSGEVLRYDGETGAFKNIFVAAGQQLFPAFLTFTP